MSSPLLLWSWRSRCCWSRAGVRRRPCDCGQRHAINTAEQAARAGAQALDIASVRAGGPYRLDPDRARRAALAYLAAAGETGTVAVSRDATGDLVSVVVPFTIRFSLLTLAGLPVLRGTGQSTARNCQGIIQEENC